MKPPIEYGDNFPVLTSTWNPTEPWRFPSQQPPARKTGLLKVILPWLTLGLGLSVGFLLSHCTIGSSP